MAQTGLRSVPAAPYAPKMLKPRPNLFCLVRTLLLAVIVGSFLSSVQAGQMQAEPMVVAEAGEVHLVGTQPSDDCSDENATGAICHSAAGCHYQVLPGDVYSLELPLTVALAFSAEANMRGLVVRPSPQPPKGLVAV